MFKKPKPFARQWDGQDHYHFIDWAYQSYLYAKHTETNYRRKFWEEPYTYREWKRLQREDLRPVAERLYRVGKQNYVLDVSFDQFWSKLDPISYEYAPRSYYRHLNRKKRYSDYYPRKGAHFRQKLNKGVIEKSDNQKALERERREKNAEWRNRKGFDQDKRKQKSRSWKKWAKHFSNREFRRHEFQLIKNDRFDDLWKYKRKDYFDPWRWD